MVNSLMNARRVLELLKRFESRNVTFIEPDGSWPTVWERARGAQVWDADGNEYLDLTAAFGVAAAGHANPRVVKAGQRQMAQLPHAMGDVHPHALKAELARELSRITFERWTRRNPKSEIRNPKSAKTIFCNSGFEAVEAALKTAMLATGETRCHCVRRRLSRTRLRRAEHDASGAFPITFSRAAWRVRVFRSVSRG